MLGCVLQIDIMRSVQELPARLEEAKSALENTGVMIISAIPDDVNERVLNGMVRLSHCNKITVPHLMRNTGGGL